ncbi:MAG: N-6 DNA methylase, partial [Candidatus Kariarchaeaceae archaeon]
MPDSRLFDSNLMIEHMVNLAVSIKNEININQNNGFLTNIYREFSSYLVKNLEFDEFADIYAQSFVYGLFSAKIIQKIKIDLDSVPIILGRASPLLEKTFTVFNQDLSRIIDPDKIGIHQFLDLLNQTDFLSLLNWFTQDEKNYNPLIHFYELFLADYNPQLKFKRGVFYTPDAIVSFIIRSVDDLLKNSLNFNSGLNDPSVIILDPAVGTGTFLNEIVKTLKENYDRINTKSPQEKRITNWNHYITDNLLKRIFGFEVMITPYIIAHLQLALLLETTGYDLTRSKDRIGVFLTNTLEGTHENKNNLTRYINNDSFLIEETDLINEIKINTPISVIVGNPPYSKFSSNKECHWIEGLMTGTITDGVRRSRYYELDGA